ncbi:MAG: ATP-binding protein, partial [Cyanobacteria bacterium P01_H01_bin.130]
MMIDACHSGDFIERSLVETGFSAFGAKQDYFLITACRGDEQGWVKKGADHSVFTGAVLDGLVREKADEEGCVTGDRLFDQVQSALKGSRQEPVRFGKGRSLSIVQFRPEVQTDTVSEDCPYQGLEAFTPETAQFFYGRQDTVRLLQERLSQFNFVPVIGASGSGKSSVVRAGLITALGDEWYVLEPIKPNAEPMAALRGAMRTLFKRKTDLNRVTELLNTEGLGPVLEMVPNSPMLPAGGAKVLLVIDQFEEVFTVCSLEEERAHFIECITAIQEIDDSPLAVVTTMRADFVEPWLDYGELVQTIQDQAVWLGRLQGEDLVRAIAQPAKRQGYELGPGLLELIL